MSNRTLSITVTEDQYQLARRRAFVEDLTWRKIFGALINAYIAGDITVTQQGRYSVDPPKSPTPVVHIRRDADLVELEPDWNVNDPRPQVGDDPVQKSRPHAGWGTSALQKHIAQETGRKIPKQYLRRLLKLLDIPKASNGRWDFRGPTDPQVATVLSAVESGVYDEMVRVGLEMVRQNAKPKEPVEDHEANHVENKRHLIAKRIRQLES